MIYFIWPHYGPKKTLFRGVCRNGIIALIDPAYACILLFFRVRLLITYLIHMVRLNPPHDIVRLQKLAICPSPLVLSRIRLGAWMV